MRFRHPTVSVAEALIRVSWRTPLRGVGGFSPVPGSADRFAQARTEASTAWRFLDAFGPHAVAIAGKRVLDFGCGYGGKAVEYGRRGALEVRGTEPFQNLIDAANAYAAEAQARNVRFDICTQDRVPYDDAAFDAVLSHDVLEHVENPAVSLNEISRVLKSGGAAYIVFPPYDGIASHHLDYVTRLPGLHWVFSPDTLIAAVNRILERQAAVWNTKPQPPPRLSWSRTRKVLPNLNGLTAAEFMSLAASAGLRIAHQQYHILGHYRVTAAQRLVHDFILSPLASLGFRERLAMGLATILVKH